MSRLHLSRLAFGGEEFPLLCFLLGDLPCMLVYFIWTSSGF